jgi:hypothetical protein
MLTVAAAVGTLGACDDDGPTEPNLSRAEVSGTYTITAMTFDPQGSLPAVDVFAEFGEDPPPRITLTENGTVQVLVQDPVTDLAITVPGTYTTTSTGVRITFSGPFADLLLSNVMQLDYDDGTLTFSGTATGGVSRARLVAIFPDLEEEQLLDPVPGSLTLTATRGT